MGTKTKLQSLEEKVAKLVELHEQYQETKAPAKTTAEAPDDDNEDDDDGAKLKKKTKAEDDDDDDEDEDEDDAELGAHLSSVGDSVQSYLTATFSAPTADHK